MTTYLKHIIALLCLMSSFLLQSQICWESYENRTCKTTLITEAGVSIRISNQDLVFGRLDNDFNIGLKRSIGDRMALGAVAFANFTMSGERNFHTGIRARIAYQINEDFTLNFSPGIILYDDGFDSTKFNGISIEGDISWKKSLAFYGRFTSQKFPFEEEKISMVNVGIKTVDKRSVWTGLGLLVLQGVILGGTFF